MSRFQQPTSGMNPYRNNRVSNFYSNPKYNNEVPFNRLKDNKSRYTPNSRLSRNSQYQNYISAGGRSKKPAMQPKLGGGFSTAQKNENQLKFYNDKAGYRSNGRGPGMVGSNPRQYYSENQRKMGANKYSNPYASPNRGVATTAKGPSRQARLQQGQKMRQRPMQPNTVQKPKGSSKVQHQKPKTASRHGKRQERSQRPNTTKRHGGGGRKDRASLAMSRTRSPQNFTFGSGMKASEMMKQRPSQLADYSSMSASKQQKPKKEGRKRRHTTGATKKNVNYEVTKSHESSKGIVRSFGICTTQGIVRNYNEDRVSVILNVTRDGEEQQMKYNSNQGGPNCSFFSVIDGHGGSNCANYLREKLHHAILNDRHFPSKCPDALKRGIKKIETDFLKIAENGNENNVDRSGACVLVALFRGTECYLANVGDCRAILSSKSGQKHSELTIDHKPGSASESKRIVAAGGYVYQTPIPKYLDNKGLPSKGPQRVMPGKLSVSRTIGDILAKDAKYGGNPKVVIPTPDIFLLNVKNTDDFIILSTDGIYDVLSSKEVIQVAWGIINQNLGLDIHEISKKCSEGIVIAAMEKKANDNLTCLFIGLPNLLQFVKQNQRNY